MNLESVAADGLDLAGILRKEIRRRLMADGQLEDYSDRALNEMGGLVTKLLRAEATMIKESRALEKDAAEKVRSMSWEQKRKVVATVVADMPAEQVVLLRSELGW